MRRLAQRRQGGRRVAQRPIAGAASAAGPLIRRAHHAHAQKTRPAAENLPALRTALYLAQKVAKGVG
nr:hypothetical protein [Acidovorax temperans]